MDVGAYEGGGFTPTDGNTFVWIQVFDTKPIFTGGEAVRS